MGQHYQSNHAEMLAAFDNFLRLVAALLFWKLSAFIANGRFAAAISRFDPYTFLLFCTHVMMMWRIATVIGPLFGRFGGPRLEEGRVGKEVVRAWRSRGEWDP